MKDGPANRRPSDNISVPSLKFSVLNSGLDWIGISYRRLGGDLEAARAGLEQIDPWRQKLAESLPEDFPDELRMRIGFTTTSAGLELAWIEVTGELLHPGTVSFVETIGREALEYAPEDPPDAEAGTPSDGPGGKPEDEPEDARRIVNLEIGETPTINRVDLATDVYFDDPSDAQLALRAFAAMIVPRHKIHVIYGDGSKTIETVSWLNSSGVQLRIYDKTAESGGGGDLVGTVVRIERQIRRRYRDQWTVSQFYEQDLSKEAIAPLKVGDDRRVLVSDYRGVDAELRERRDQGKTTDAVSEGLLGALVRAYAAGPKAWTNPKTARRRYKQLAKAGIAVDPDLTENVDLGKILAAVQTEWEKYGRSAGI